MSEVSSCANLVGLLGNSVYREREFLLSPSSVVETKQS